MTQKNNIIMIDKLDLSNWRQKTKEEKLLKLTDEKKILYLERLYEHGGKMMAAREIGISYTCLQDHRETDLEFAALIDEVLNLRAEKIVKRLEQEAIEGYDEHIVNKDGEIVGTRKKYETPLRAMIMKRFDAEYRDKTDINLTGNSASGVLVLPAEVTLEQALEEAKRNREQMLKDQKEMEQDDTDFRSKSDR